MNPRPPLENQRFDVVVIGGGISGVAIARECARAGRRTLLVEQHDFAAGTTSRSTRIIHGGLRYLEHGDIAQVRASLRERQRLLRQYPHLVQPLEFLLALDARSHRSAMAIRVGLWLYRRMGGGTCERPRAESQQDKLERLLDTGRHFSVFSFDDAQCEFPERLVAEWLVEAVEAGCVARNHTQVVTVDIRDGVATGVLLRDQLSGQEEHVESRWIINATGPWADGICEKSAIRTQQPMVGGVRGSHIVLPRFAGAPDAALYTEAVDGRPVFVVPWNGQMLVGTTEVPDGSDPARVQPSKDEIDYLLRSLRELFPQIAVSEDDVQYSFAGVRPLPYSPNASPSALSRRHYLHDHAPDGAAHMISVIGGKLTTAGWVARECAVKVGISASGPARPSVALEGDVGGLLEQWITEVEEAGGISRGAARSLAEWYGRRSLAIARSARDREELRTPLCPHTQHIVAEALHAFAHEHATTLADVLLRRVPVALGACWSTECSRAAADGVAAATGWSQRRAGSEFENFEAERGAFLQKPPRTTLMR